MSKKNRTIEIALLCSYGVLILDIMNVYTLVNRKYA